MFFQGDQFSFDPSNWIPPSIYFLSLINTLLINFPFHGGLVWSGWYPLDLKAKYVINLHPLPTFHPALCNGPSIHHILSIFLLHPQGGGLTVLVISFSWTSFLHCFFFFCFHIYFVLHSLLIMEFLFTWYDPHCTRIIYFFTYYYDCQRAPSSDLW